MSACVSIANKKFILPTTELMLLLVAIFWGTSYGVTKGALVYTSIFSFMAIRFLLTCFCLSYFTMRDFKNGKNKNWTVALPTGAILFAIFTFEIVGVSLTSASNAAFLISLSIIFTAFSEVLVNKTPLDKRLLILSLFTLFGVFLLVSHEHFSLLLNLGDILIICAALSRALMVTMVKRLTKNKEVTSLSLTSIQSGVVGVGAIAVLTFQTQGDFSAVIPSDMNFWVLTSYLVVFCTLFAFFMQNYAVRRLSATRVSLLMGSEPLFGALFATIFLDESLSLIQLLGGGIIVICVILTSYYRKV